MYVVPTYSAVDMTRRKYISFYSASLTHLLYTIHLETVVVRMTDRDASEIKWTLKIILLKKPTTYLCVINQQLFTYINMASL